MEVNGQAWKTAKVEDLSSFITVGFVGSMSSLFVDEGVPLLRGQNILPYRLDLTNLKFIAPSTHRKWKKSALKPRDVVIVRVGYPGTACVIPDGLGDLNAASLVIVRPNPELLDSDFLCYVLNSPWGKARIQGRLVGAAQQVFNTHTAADLDIPAPPLPIQRRIAGILSAYDELIENSQRRIKILESMARALYREWFVHFRFPGHDNPAGQPDWTAEGRPAGASATDGASQSVPRVPSPLGEIPQGWEVKKLGDIAQDMRRNVPKGKLDEPQPYVGLEHIPRRSLALDDWETTTELGSTKLEFKKGEVLFGKIRPYFHKVSVAPFDGLCSADTIIIRARRPEHYAFVVACVSSDEFVAHATATSNGSKMPRANWTVLEKYGVAIPTGKVAEQFSAMITDSVAQQQALVFQIQNLRRTRDLLLPRLLSGQIDVEALAP